MSSATFNITPSLAEYPRHNLEAWTENVETHARNMCASHDIMGALTLVVSEVTWDMGSHSGQPNQPRRRRKRPTSCIPQSSKLGHARSSCRKRRFGSSQLASHADGEVQITTSVWPAAH
jgi:hypothetical protein